MLFPEADARDFEYEGIWYTVTDETAKTVETRAGTGKYKAGNTASGILEIPEKVSDGESDYTVTGIGDWSFSSQYSVTELYLPPTLRNLGVGSFYDCGIKTVEIPDGVTEIKASLFAKNPLKRVFLPPSVKSVYSSTSNWGEYGSWVDDNPFMISSTYDRQTYAMVVYPSTYEGKSMDFKRSSESIGYYKERCSWIDGFFVEQFGISPSGRTLIRIVHISNRLKGVQFVPSQITGFCDFSSVVYSNSGLKVLVFNTKEPICTHYDYEDENHVIIVARNHQEYSGKRSKIIEIAGIYNSNTEVIYENKCLYEISTHGGKIAAIYTDEDATLADLRNDVTEIRGYAFYHNPKLIDAIIPQGVKSISGSAFSDCSNLCTVIFPSSLREITYEQVLSQNRYNNTYGVPFENLPNLKSIELNEGLRRLYGFNNCPMLEIKRFSDSLEVIEGLSNIALKSAEFPVSLKSISGFNDCENLTYIEFPAGCQVYFYGDRWNGSPVDTVRVNGMPEVGHFNAEILKNATLFVKEPYLEAALNHPNLSKFEKIECDGKECVKFDDDVYQYRLNPFTGEAMLLRSDNLLTSGRISIPNRVVLETEEGAAFHNVTAIGPAAFNGATSLTEVVLPRQLKIVGPEAFRNCTALKSIALPETTETLYGSSFRNTGLESMDIPASVRKIGTCALAENKSLKEINFHSVQDVELEAHAFAGNPILEKLLLPAGAYPAPLKKEIDGIVYNNAGNACRNLVADCKALKTANWPNSMNTICSGAFAGCSSLTDITIENGIAEIGFEAFRGCSALMGISIPSSVRLVGEQVFKSCSSLQSIVIPPLVTNLKSYTFIGCKALNEVRLNENLKKIGTGAFDGCTSLKEIELNAAMDSIESIAFLDCTALDRIGFNASLTAIRDNAFQNCTALKSVEFNAGLESIGKEAFKGCKGIESILFKDSPLPIEIDPKAFDGVEPKYIGFGRPVVCGTAGDNITAAHFCMMEGLEEVEIGNTVTAIESGMFAGLSRLKSAKLGSSLTSIPDFAFERTGLSEIVIPSSVTEIGNGAFASVPLQSLSIGSGITKIGERCFYDNDKIEAVSITAAEPPAATNDCFSYYGGSLNVTPESRTAYEDCPRCWYRFNTFGLVRPQEVRKADDVTLSYAPGTTQQLEVTVLPENTSLKHIMWSSTNPEVATVDHNGLVTYHKVKTAETMRAAEPSELQECKIIASTLYDDGPVAVFTVYGYGADIPQTPMAQPSDIDYSLPYDVYQINGMRIGAEVDGLAPGLYIIRQNGLAKKIAVH